MTVVCPRCADQKVTSKLLCKQVLRNDMFNLINSFNGCKRCEDIANQLRFIETFNSEPWLILHYSRTIYSVQNHILNRNINHRINKHSMGYLRYVGHCLSYGHTPLDRYRYECEARVKEMIRKRKRRRDGDENIDLKRLSLDFFSRLFLKRFDNETAQFMIKTLIEILYF